jgi:hypothetical protein
LRKSYLLRPNRKFLARSEPLPKLNYLVKFKIIRVELGHNVKLRINERKESYQIRITQNLLSSIHKLI